MCSFRSNKKINISVDIIKYLQEKKEMSIDEIAKSMDSTEKHIQNIINKKSTLTPDELRSYFNSTNSQFWELAYEGNLLKYLPEKIKRNVLLCHQIFDHIEKKRKKKLESE